MRRVYPLLIAVVLGCLLLGLSIWSLQDTAVASAALPPEHPNIARATAQITSTLSDFFLPGTQPGMLTDTIPSPEHCRSCHADYAELTGQPAETETWTSWRGSMMSQAARDPLFWAALDIANADAGFAGDICLRCHTPSGWLEGRSEPSDGSALIDNDFEGVQCEACHRMVDPYYSDENPPRDLIVLNEIAPALTFTGNGAIIVDPLDERRGPFDLQEDWLFNPHAGEYPEWPLKSPYHREAALCGSCHDVSNPLLSWDEGAQEYMLNELDAPASDPDTLFPVERTYSEWLLSDYNTPGGIYAPQFGGNDPYVSTCQDCHMRTITGAGGNFFGNYVLRDDMPIHDLTGGNTWIPQTLPLHPEFGDNFTGPEGELRAQALISGTNRARYMLQNAATLSALQLDNQLTVTITNQSGHKLPSGYPEGRRMWLQVEGYDAEGNLAFSSGAYDVETGILEGYGSDPLLKVYEAKQGLTPGWAAELGLTAGPTFHFVLNNVILSDNRIPPRGYDFDAFSERGAAPYTDGLPDPDRYAAGQYWDVTAYELPEDVAYGVVRLLYQTASKEYIEFLRDNNPDFGAPGNNGQILYDLWLLSERGRPEVMAESSFYATPPAFSYLPAMLKNSTP